MLINWLKNNFSSFLKNNYNHSFFNVDKMLSLADVNPILRAEDLHLDAFVRLSNAVFDMNV